MRSKRVLINLVPRASVTLVQRNAFSSPEPTILLACGRNRELWEQPFQACAIDSDCVKPDGQNSVISFVISKWLLPELSFSDRWSRGTEALGTRLGLEVSSQDTRENKKATDRILLNWGQFLERLVKP